VFFIHAFNMRKILVVILLFVFASTFSGLRENAYAKDTATIVSIQTIHTDRPESFKCCALQENETDSLSPRCVGEICIMQVALHDIPSRFSDKLKIRSSLKLEVRVDAIFLRPPIA